MEKNDIGVIGLSVMGRNLALNIADHGFRVAGYNRSAEVTRAVARTAPRENLRLYEDLGAFAASLARPRRVLMMIQAGPPVDAVLGQLAGLLEAGDIVLDGGNSFFEDTRRRERELLERGLCYFGVGISGGEAGARRGPSIMPGGDAAAYEAVRPILEAVAAKAQGAPCCAYIGPDGAGHYVKMVHNGIEYADMQLIAEAYLLLRHAAGFGNDRLAETFSRWNEGELRGFLTGITARILREPDDLGPGELVDRIADRAAQKGTGRWTSVEALRQGIDCSMITAAVDARVRSNLRREGARPAAPDAEGPDFAGAVRRGLYAAKIAAYAQGFALLGDASDRYGWSLDLGRIASIWRAGCIIQAAFLDDIARAFGREDAPESLLADSFFGERVAENLPALRRAAAAGIRRGLPLPAMTSALAYLEALAGAPAGANLIQAQRDCFGAHTYERADRPGVFHHEWGPR